MREIKFRVYDKDLAKYLEGCEIDSLMAELSAEGDSRAVIIKQICPARYIFEQYTGLKDKNGKEIYDGDIVTVWIEGCKQNSPVVVGEDIRELYYEFNRDDPYYRFTKVEVIGNIHESNMEELENANS